jgi:hypothetical protein
MKTVASTALFILHLFYDREDAGNMFRRNSVAFQRTTWRYIAEDGTHNNHRGENLNSYRIKIRNNALKKRHFRRVFSYGM